MKELMNEEVPRTATAKRMVSAMFSSFTECLEVRRDEYFLYCHEVH